MPSPLDTILDLVKRKVSEQQRGGSGGILGQITDMLGSRKAKKPGQHSVRPASEDPYGDPATKAAAELQATRSSQPAKTRTATLLIRSRPKLTAHS